MFVYLIEGKEYTSARKAAAAHGISDWNVDNRVKSSDPKWINWMKFRIYRESDIDKI